MSMCRRFNGKPVTRLIVTMPAEFVVAIDQLLADRPTHPARGCRSEFLRLAVAEKVGRELMLCGEQEPRSPAVQLSAISQFDGPMIEFGDGRRGHHGG